MQERIIHISTKTILKILLLVGILYVLYLVWDILLLVFISLILASLIDPFAEWLKEKRIPRGVAVLIIYVVLLGLLGILIGVLAPVIVRDVPQVASQLSSYVEQFQQTSFWQSTFGDTSLVGEAGDIGSRLLEPVLQGAEAFTNLFSTISGVFRGLFAFILVLVITFYMVVQEDPLRKVLRSVVPEAYLPKTLSVLSKIRETLSAWMRGQLILSGIVGVMVYIGLTLLNIKYAAVIAILAAFLEFIPYLGPILAAVPAIFFAFIGGGWVQILLVVSLYIVVQQVENHILVPKVMQHAVGLNPIVSIIAVLIGAEIAGIIGALLAIPVATAIRILMREVFVESSAIPTPAKYQDKDIS